MLKSQVVKINLPTKPLPNITYLNFSYLDVFGFSHVDMIFKFKFMAKAFSKINRRVYFGFLKFV